MICIALLDYGRCFAPGGIDPLPREVEPHIVVEARYGKRGYELPCIGVENDELWGFPSTDKQAMIGLIEDQRIAGFGIRNRPFLYKLPRVQIYDPYFIS